MNLPKICIILFAFIFLTCFFQDDGLSDKNQHARIIDKNEIIDSEKKIIRADRTHLIAGDSISQMLTYEIHPGMQVMYVLALW